MPDLDVNSYFKNYTINCSSFGNELNVLNGIIEVRRNATLMMLAEELEGKRESSLLVADLNNNFNKDLITMGLDGTTRKMNIYFNLTSDNKYSDDMFDGGTISIIDYNFNNFYDILLFGAISASNSDYKLLIKE